MVMTLNNTCRLTWDNTVTVYLCYVAQSGLSLLKEKWYGITPLREVLGWSRS